MYNVNMNLRFVWDDEKNRENIKKHGVSFDEAKSIFLNFPLEPRVLFPVLTRAKILNPPHSNTV